MQHEVHGADRSPHCPALSLSLSISSDENGAFVHGALNIGAGGMVVSGGGGSRSSGSSSSNALTVEEAEELKSMSNTRLEDLEVRTTAHSHRSAATRETSSGFIRWLTLAHSWPALFPLHFSSWRSWARAIRPWCTVRTTDDSTATSQSSASTSMTNRNDTRSLRSCTRCTRCEQRETGIRSSMRRAASDFISSLADRVSAVASLVVVVCSATVLI